jgi:tRNA nucleotidyltransferase (CCA-adding enzyme)
MQFSLGDQWSRKLFLALCRRYGLEPYRLYRQRVTTVMLKVPRAFVDQVLWPEFQELDAALAQYLNEVTNRIIRDEVHRDTSEAAEIKQQALPGR